MDLETGGFCVTPRFVGFTLFDQEKHNAIANTKGKEMAKKNITHRVLAVPHSAASKAVNHVAKVVLAGIIAVGDLLLDVVVAAAGAAQDVVIAVAGSAQDVVRAIAGAITRALDAVFDQE